jgi:hypothetical protein
MEPLKESGIRMTLFMEKHLLAEQSSQAHITELFPKTKVLGKPQRLQDTPSFMAERFILVLLIKITGSFKN